MTGFVVTNTTADGSKASHRLDCTTDAMRSFTASMMDSLKPSYLLSAIWRKNKSETLAKMASIFHEQHDFVAAERHLEMAINCNEMNPQAHKTFCHLLLKAGQADKAAQLLGSFLEKCGEEGDHLTEGEDAWFRDDAESARKTVLNLGSIRLFVRNYGNGCSCSPRTVYDEHRTWAALMSRHVAHLKCTGHDNTRDPSRRIKLAYVSGGSDFTQTLSIRLI